MLDDPLQIGVVNIGRSSETWTHNLASGDNDRQFWRKNRRETNKLAVSDVYLPIGRGISGIRSRRFFQVQEIGIPMATVIVHPLFKLH